jgi:predicted ATP-dependent Lon-type protease
VATAVPAAAPPAADRKGPQRAGSGAGAGIVRVDTVKLDSLVPVENLAQAMQVVFDAGGKRILLPMASVTDIPTIPGELFAKFQTSFYADPVDAVFKALGVQ